MTEHELFIARKAYQSRINHTRFRRRNLKAEKLRRKINNIRIHFIRTGEIKEIAYF